MNNISQKLYKKLLAVPYAIVIPLVLWIIASSNLFGFSEKSRDLTLDFLTQSFPYDEVFQSYAEEMLFIDIDEKSLNEIGQWPWPRQTMANIFKEIDKKQPLVVGVDIIFSENDRYASKNLAEFFNIDETELNVLGIKDGDKDLADTMLEKPYVIAISAIDKNDQSQEKQAVISGKMVVINAADELLYQADKLLTPIKALENTTGFGFVNTIKEDGIIRKTPLILNINNQLYPSLNLDMIRVAQNASTHIVKKDDVGDKLLVKSGEMVAQLDLDGVFNLHHGNADRFPRASILDVMRGEIDLQDKIIIVGSSASGLGDFHASNIESEVAGPLFHLQVIDQVLGQRFINFHPVYDQIIYFLALLFAIALSMLVAQLPIYAILLLVPTAILPLYYLAKYAFLGFGMVVNMPVAAGIFFFSAIGTFVVRSFIQNIEKKKIQNSFLQYVPENIVKNINKASDVPSLGGQEINGTVFFADIRGFTSISETLKNDPNLFVNVISHIMGRVTEILIQHEATIDKYIGDAIMAFWNAPVTVEDHQLKSYKAAKAIKIAIPAINREIKAMLPKDKRKEITINLGMGISTGNFIVGNMGSEFRFNYSVMGDIVNIAARLESMTKEKKKSILAGAENITAETIKDFKKQGVSLTLLDRLAVRGKKEKIAVYEIK